MTWTLVKEKKKLEIQEQEDFEHLDSEEEDCNNNPKVKNNEGCFNHGETSSGIGPNPKKLANLGFHLILCGRNEKILIDLKNSLSKITDVVCLVFDVRNKNDVFKKIGSLDKKWRDIDVLINNGAAHYGKDLLVDDDVENWEVMIDGNVKGLLYVSKAVIPRMVERKGGHIINISSIAGKETYEGGVVYCASKKSVESISEGMRIELTKHNIKVSNIAQKR